MFSLQESGQPRACCRHTGQSRSPSATKWRQRRRQAGDECLSAILKCGVACIRHYRRFSYCSSGLGLPGLRSCPGGCSVPGRVCFIPQALGWSQAGRAAGRRSHCACAASAVLRRRALCVWGRAGVPSANASGGGGAWSPPASVWARGDFRGCDVRLAQVRDFLLASNLKWITGQQGESLTYLLFFFFGLVGKANISSKKSAIFNRGPQQSVPSRPPVLCFLI